MKDESFSSQFTRILDKMRKVNAGKLSKSNDTRAAMANHHLLGKNYSTNS